jgi:hypothetical protein
MLRWGQALCFDGEEAVEMSWWIYRFGNLATPRGFGVSWRKRDSLHDT